MKLAALAPAALFVLVSMCGSPVPPPPGAITGHVFFDVNHNSLNDSCDSPLGNLQISATISDGTTRQVRAANDGSYRIDDVPPGDASVTLTPSDGFAWPITTLADGATGIPVSVESSKDAAAAGFHKATHWNLFGFGA